MAVANAELLFTTADARQIAHGLAEAGATQVGTADVLSLVRGLLARGLPVPPVELFADAIGISGDEHLRRIELAKMAVRTLLASAGERYLARQLHQDARQLLQEMVEGGFVGEEVEALRYRIVAEAWKRPDWRWPMVIVEAELRPHLERLLADCRAEIVVIGPDELPAGVRIPSVEVLGSDST